MKKILFVCMATVVFFSCKKDSGDTKGPVIVLSSPQNNQVFNAGESIKIIAAITEDDEIHMVELHVQNKVNSADILHLEEHADAKTFAISKTISAQSGIVYKIEVTADDHSGNQSKVQIEVAVK